MNQQENRDEKIPAPKGIFAWVKEILHGKREELEELPAPPAPEVITTLISKASGNSEEPGEDRIQQETGEQEKTEEPVKPGDPDKPEEKKSCPYYLKRNIVASLQEIRRFAEEHNLAAAMIRALLTLLADMAVGALKGKVSGNVLEALLKIFNFEREKEEAYRRGETDGRNARIIEEQFPAASEEIPHLKGGATPVSPSPNIFSMARESH